MSRETGGRIFIRDFRLPVSIGIHDFEKEGPQTVVVNVNLLLEPADRAHNDRIANVLNYDVVHDGIRDLAGSLIGGGIGLHPGRCGQHDARDDHE